MEYRLNLSDSSSDTPERVGGSPESDARGRQNVPDSGADQAYGVMIESLRDFLDKVAAAKLDEATAESLASDLQSWSQKLASLAVGESEQVFARRRDLPGNGGTMVPSFTMLEADDRSMRGVSTFGRYFLGGGGAAHGGAIPLLLDHVIGRLANSGGRPIARTVSLKTDYRSITPVGPELAVSAWFVSEEGRKRVLRAEIRHGDKLCAEAECLLVTLQPGQAWSELPAP